MPGTDLQAVLTTLSTGGVEFILVGGTAAVLNGAPVNTYDVDIVPARSEENIAKLLRVLDSLDAIYRMQPSRQLKPEASHLSSPGHHNLITSLGPLDVLGTIGRGLTYEDLLPHTREMAISEGIRIRVLTLAKIIALKEELGGEKDLATLPVLRRTLELQRKPAAE
jgi:predicted nucleotidyltransferase